MHKLKHLVLGTILGFGLLWSSQVQATCDISSSFSTGQVLTAAQLNTLVTDGENCTNNVLNGDTFTGNMVWHSGTDALLYSDTGSTLKASIAGDSGKIIGAPAYVGTFNNLNLDAATTTNAGDSIIIECGNATCSATNPGFVVAESATAGQLAIFPITADVTINLTGAHWENGTRGDLTDAILRVFFVNNNGSAVWCVGLLGGRTTLLSTNDSTTGTDINLAEEVLCNAAVDSATNSVHEFGWVRANFDDSGGAAEDLWAVQTGVGDLNYGSADGHFQPFNPVWTGFSAAPTMSYAKWTQYGRTIKVSIDYTGFGTSDAVTMTVTNPADARVAEITTGLFVRDNGANTTTAGRLTTAADSAVVTASSDHALTGWTGSSTKAIGYNWSYEVGPAASFIP